jgi:uncharacterized damage-inducible protein DinB
MTRVTESLIKLFDRDLEKLDKEISSYPSEESLWLVPSGINNSAGNLCLHLCGNLQHFVGTILGSTNYKRDREHEFAAKNIVRDILQQEIENTKLVVAQTLRKLDVEALDQEYPIQVFGHPMTTAYFLIHLAGHLNYHLGQINYHRRLVGTAPM